MPPPAILDKVRYAIVGLTSSDSGQWKVHQNPPGTYLYTFIDSVEELRLARLEVQGLRDLFILNVETGNRIQFPLV